MKKFNSQSFYIGFAMRLNQKILFSLLTLMLGTLFGCQNTEKIKCEQTNWRQQAYLDALNGSDINDFKKTKDRCLKLYKINIKSELYQEGFETGLAKLCHPDAAMQLGLSGKEYRGTCKNLDEEKFLTAYRKGRLVFFRQLYNENTKKILDSEARVWRKQNEYELEANSNPEAAREAYDVLESYRSELSRLQKEKEQLKQKIDELITLTK